MITKKQVMLIALGACLVGLSALGSAKNPVTRPLKAHGHITIVFNYPTPGAVTSTMVANWSHLGLVISIGHGSFHIEDGVPVLEPATGTATAANGDQLFWKTESATAPTIFTGGTGRFVGATGAVTKAEYLSMVPGVNADGLPTLDADFDAEGTLTY